MRFALSALADLHVALTLGPADIQEIFGSQFELPELGPLGTHGLANPRDFETPVASFDVDQSPWESTFLPPTSPSARPLILID